MSLLRLAPPASSVLEEVPGTPSVRTLPGAPWRLMCPTDVVLLNVADHRGVRQLRGRLEPGKCVGLLCERHGSRRRLRHVARALDLEVERELIVLPRLDHPLVVLDDLPEPVGYLWESIATVPPGMAVAGIPAAAALRLARKLPWSWTGEFIPGRVLIGRAR